MQGLQKSLLLLLLTVEGLRPHHGDAVELDDNATIVGRFANASNQSLELQELERRASEPLRHHSEPSRPSRGTKVPPAPQEVWDDLNLRLPRKKSSGRRRGHDRRRAKGNNARRVFVDCDAPYSSLFGPGDWVRVGDEPAQVEDCDNQTCRLHLLHGKLEGSDSRDTASPVLDKETMDVDSQKLTNFDSFQRGDKVLFRDGPKWKVGEIQSQEGTGYKISPRVVHQWAIGSKIDAARRVLEGRTPAALKKRYGVDLRRLQKFRVADQVIAWNPETKRWFPGKVLQAVHQSISESSCPKFSVEDDSGNATLDLPGFHIRLATPLRKMDYVQIKSTKRVGQVRLLTYESEYQVYGLDSRDNRPHSYFYNQLLKLNAEPSWEYADPVMALDSENGFWYPAVIARGAFSSPYQYDADGKWDGLYRIRWQDAKSDDLYKTDLELKSFTGQEVTQLVQKVRPEDCSKRLFAARLDKDAMCPQMCPFWSETKFYCSFKCVGVCPNFLESPAYVMDAKENSCKRCGVRQCKRCASTDRLKCETCLPGYKLDQEGAVCSKKPTGFLSWLQITMVTAAEDGTVVLSTVTCLLAIIVAWYVDMRTRGVTNTGAIEAVDAFATSQRLLRKGADSGLYPMLTNLQTQPVAGLGLMFMMNFQCVVILLAALVLGMWYIVLWIEPELADLGKGEVDDSRVHCSIAHWGAEVQNMGLIPELLFTLAVYVVMFAFSLAVAALQRTRYLEHDAGNITMKDYAAVVKGVPAFLGEESAEEIMSQAIQKSTGQKVVGVSICWDFREEQHRVNACIDRSLDHPEQSEEPAVGSGMLGGMFFKIEQRLGFGPPRPEAAEVADPVEVRRLLLSLKTSGAAFAVFETEVARDAAVSASAGIELPNEKATLTLECAFAEPDSVRWGSFGGGKSDYIRRWVRAICELTAVILFLMTFLKYPYSRYVMSFSYAETGTPNNLNGKFLTLISIIANQVIYLFSDKVAEDMHFWYTEHKQKAYVAFYVVAMVLELMMDLFFTATTTFNQLNAAGRRTYGGVQLYDLPSWHMVIETYVMQNALGNQLLDYAFPSTFIAPFLFEPILGFLLFHIGKLIVRSHSEISPYRAQKLVQWFWINDLSRYGDIILNLTIAVIFLSIHGGFNSRAFGYLLVCHLYIYVFDHWMLLRAMPRVKYNLMAVDTLAHVLMSIPSGMALCCVIFKANCKNMLEHPYGRLWPFPNYCVTSMNLIGLLVAAFLVHAIIHVLIVYLLMTFIRVKHNGYEVDYLKAAKTSPCTWFSANPVHCLRSEHLKHDSPHCRHHVPGREHLLRANEKIGCSFEDPDLYSVKYRGWHLLSNT